MKRLTNYILTCAIFLNTMHAVGKNVPDIRNRISGFGPLVLKDRTTPSAQLIDEGMRARRDADLARCAELERLFAGSEEDVQRARAMLREGTGQPNDANQGDMERIWGLAIPKLIEDRIMGKIEAKRQLLRGVELLKSTEFDFQKFDEQRRQLEQKSEEARRRAADTSCTIS